MVIVGVALSSLAAVPSPPGAPIAFSLSAAMSVDARVLSELDLLLPAAPLRDGLYGRLVDCLPGLPLTVLG